MDEEEERAQREERAQARDARAGYTPAAVGRILLANAETLDQFRKREEQHDRHDAAVQERVLGLYDQIGLLHAVIRDKDREISELRRDDRDLKAEEIKADVERSKIAAKVAGTQQLFAFLSTLAPELADLAAKARVFRDGGEQDQTYAEGLWMATGALFQALEKDATIFARIEAVAGPELIELVKVLKSYKAHNGGSGST